MTLFLHNFQNTFSVTNNIAYYFIKMTLFSQRKHSVFLKLVPTLYTKSFKKKWRRTKDKQKQHLVK